MAGICDDLNVLELGSGSVAASITGMVLADAGARVVKVEPAEGDRLRVVNPSGFLVWNRGKESLVADLRSPDGQQDARELAANADVVIEGFAPGTTARWGLDAACLHSINPALVHCSITAFGQTGPYAALKGYDSLVAAKCGLWARGAFGHRAGPIMYPVPWASFGAAMQSVAGIMGALMVRDITGRGQSVDATLFAGLDPLDYFVATIAQLMVKRGEKPSTDARSAVAASRYGVLLATSDGRFVQTSTLLPHQGKALCDVAGIGHVVTEPRFSRLPMFDTVDDAQAWEDLLLEAFREHDLAYWLPKLLASPDIAFEVAVTSEQGLDHPQIVHNGDVITVDDPRLGPVREVGPICHVADAAMMPGGSAPAVGENGGPFDPRRAHRATGAAPEHPFAGVTIVEFGYFYAMPYALAMAAALGARVIKIEDVNGDPHRKSFGPDVASNKTTAGKESLSVDLRRPEGRAIAQQIVASSDVFVTGFRSGVAERVGLGYDDLTSLNPRLAYVHAAGYGTDGPYAHRALYAQAAQAVAGSFGRQVGHWSDPAMNEGMSVIELQAVVLPRLGQVVDGDSNAALALFAAIGLVLRRQRTRGEGGFISTSMISGNAWAYADDFCSYASKPPLKLADDEYYGTDALDRLYPAADDTWVCVAIRSDSEFRRLADALGDGVLATDDRFATCDARAVNDAALVGALTQQFARRDAATWEALGVQHRVGVVAANLQGQPMMTSFDAGLLEAGLTVRYEHPIFGEMVRAAPPLTFSETPGRVAPPCIRGEHNRSILAELGYADDAIDQLEAAGVIAPPAR
jgi:crotonobetainyl-CoA:carnitine CoA-transferase CaiB-like acyl-CoA transferase